MTHFSDFCQESSATLNDDGIKSMSTYGCHRVLNIRWFIVIINDFRALPQCLNADPIAGQIERIGEERSSLLPAIPNLSASKNMQSCPHSHNLAKEVVSHG
jgi:hypothetical protein